MHIAILTFEGFNELDSLIALGILNRVARPGWRVSLACPAPRVRSMNGVVLEAQASLGEACSADAVIVGSGRVTRFVVAETALMSQTLSRAGWSCRRIGMAVNRNTCSIPFVRSLPVVLRLLWSGPRNTSARNSQSTCWSGRR